MTQQKSENRVVPDGRRKSVGTQGFKPFGGGKAVPVKEVDQQPKLAVVTAENSRNYRGADDTNIVDLFTVELCKVQQTTAKLRQGSPVAKEPATMLDEIQGSLGDPRPVQCTRRGLVRPRESPSIERVPKLLRPSSTWAGFCYGRDPAGGGGQNPPS